MFVGRSRKNRVPVAVVVFNKCLMEELINVHTFLAQSSFNHEEHYYGGQRMRLVPEEGIL